MSAHFLPKGFLFTFNVQQAFSPVLYALGRMKEIAWNIINNILNGFKISLKTFLRSI